jgi:tetratricopeptide (TPR) repeat protein
MRGSSTLVRVAAQALSLSLLVIASQAQAQEGGSARDEEARALYQAGVIAYDGGHFDEALEHFQRSYELSGRDALLYNIATAAERARQDELALESYEAFLAAKPDSPLRARVETRIGELRALLADQEARRAAEEAEEARLAEERTHALAPEMTEAAPAAPESRRSLGPALMIGAGAAVAVAGAVMLGLGLSDREAVESPAAGADSWRDDVAHRYDRGEPLLNTGLVALPLGVVAAVAGTVWQMKIAHRRDDDSSDGAQVEVGFGLGSASLRGRF